MGQDIRHTGRVVGIREGAVDVMIIPESACGSCKSRKACGMAESAEKVVTIIDTHSYLYREGDEVEVSTEKVMGMKAVAIAYIYPFILMLACLLVLLQSGSGELTAGLASLGLVAVYYLGLILFRKKLQKEIIFRISPKA